MQTHFREGDRVRISYVSQRPGNAPIGTVTLAYITVPGLYEVEIEATHERHLAYAPALALVSERPTDD